MRIGICWGRCACARLQSTYTRNTSVRCAISGTLLSGAAPLPWPLKAKNCVPCVFSTPTIVMSEQQQQFLAEIGDEHLVVRNLPQDMAALRSRQVSRQL